MKTIVMQSWKILAVLVSVIAVSGCDDDDDDEVDPDRMTATEFVQMAAASDVFEIESGQMATQNSTTLEVTTFGQMLVDDHTQTSQQLMTLAQQNNVNVQMPEREDLPQDMREDLTRLEGKTGTEFDQDFLDTQIAAHQQAIDLYEEAADELENQALRTFAQNTLPALQAHLEMAQELREQLGG